MSVESVKLILSEILNIAIWKNVESSERFFSNIFIEIYHWLNSPHEHIQQMVSKMPQSLFCHLSLMKQRNTNCWNFRFVKILDLEVREKKMLAFENIKQWFKFIFILKQIELPRFWN